MILDTNAISAMAEQDPFIAAVIPKPIHQFLPVPALGEYRSGIIRSRFHRELGDWLDRLEESRPILFIDAETARHYGRIKADLKRRGQLIPINDVWIAALAMQHNQAILSEDRHFDDIEGIKRASWKK